MPTVEVPAEEWADGELVSSGTVTVEVTEAEANKSAMETNLEQDLAVMQTILDTPNNQINAAAAIKDIARMNKRLGRFAIDDYSEAD